MALHPKYITERNKKFKYRHWALDPQQDRAQSTHKALRPL